MGQIYLYVQWHGKLHLKQKLKGHTWYIMYYNEITQTPRTEITSDTIKSLAQLHRKM